MGLVVRLDYFPCFLVLYTVNKGEMRNACKVFSRKPERKRPLGRPRHKSGDNIRIDFREVGARIAQWYSTGLCTE
jgi:hypothetical protein